MFLWGLALAAVMATITRVLYVRLHQLRLTDWLGYIALVAGLVAVPSWQWAISPWLLLSVPVALVYGVRRGQRTLQAWRRGEVVYGIFTFGKPPAGVQDRFRAWAAQVDADS